MARCLPVVLVMGVVAAGIGFAAPASAAAPPTLALKILLLGQGSTDPTTAAWQSALDAEGVPYTLVTASGGAPTQTVTLPALSSGNVGNYNGIVIADSPNNYTAATLGPLFTYESTFGVRQLDGYMYPSPALGVTDISGGVLDGTTATLTAAGLATMPELKGPVLFDTGTFGNPATVNAGAPFTSFVNNADGSTLGGVYRHPSGADPQAGVSELSLFFNYNANQMQWLLLSSGLINWVTQNSHLGLYRNYFGQDIDDVFIADNEWSSQFQCTPGATEPPDYTCPIGVANNPADTPPDTLMNAADVAYIVKWQQATGIRLNLAFNAVGACTGPNPAPTSSAVCNGKYNAYTDPGYVVESGAADSGALVDALLGSKAEFNWIMHTWSHAFLGCVVWQPQPLTSVAAGSGGTLTAGDYKYQITAATAYGESEPSLPQGATVAAGGSATLTWPEASNGDGTTQGPTLAQEQANHTGGTGFWGYNVYRQNPGSTTYGLVGHVAENPAATSATTYSYRDAGTAAGAAPGSGSDFPTATNPGIDCANGSASWNPATSADVSSIEPQIGLDQAFAAANGLDSLPASQYTQSAIVTGEHSGVENPNMPTALDATGITTFAQDASRQPQQYKLGGASGAPRYPSNIYYNASNWADELNEYNTLYVAQGVSLGGSGGIGHCENTSSTTCLAAPASKDDLLKSESHIMLTHVLGNNPRVGYAHQPNLIGPDAATGYTILGLIDSMLAQYNAWFTDPVTQMTDVSSAQTLARQSAWAAAEAGGKVSASVTNGVVTVANTGDAVDIPVTVPAGTIVTDGVPTTGGAFGQAYGGQRSDWINVGTAPLVLTEHVAPTILSGASAASIVGAAFSFTVSTTGAPLPAITESGTLPAGVTFTDNGNGTATIAGTPTAGSGGSYSLGITATNTTGSATQTITLINSEAPTITSATTATFSTGVAGTYTVKTTGYPAATITMTTGTLPSGMAFLDKGDGTATISGTPTTVPNSAGTYPVAISATNSSHSTATLQLTITVTAATAPAITSPASANFTLGSAGSVAIVATGSPIPAITETGTLPTGLTFTDNGKGTALLQGTPTASGTTTLTITAANGISPNATQTFTLIVGQAPTAFSSASSATFTAGTPGSFTVATTGGYPIPAIGASGLPSGIGLTDNGNGTATMSGTPIASEAGPHTVVFTAINGTGSITQNFTLTVNAAPVFASPTSAPFTVGQAGSFTVSTTGYPAATLTETGTLLAGLTFTANTDGTATISGTPTAGGTATVTITAHNGVGTDVTQTLTITANIGPAFSSTSSTTFAVGTAGTFSVTSTGTPTPAITQTGTLPTGITFTANSNGTATLAGTPAATAGGRYPLTFTATNANGTVSQVFTLTVNEAPAFTSGATATFAAGQVSSFAVTTAGSPAATLIATGALPGGVTFTSNADGTATISGTPAAGSQGSYPLTITASNGVGSTATQAFNLVVNSGLAITSAASATATGGTAFSFTVTTTGTPTPTLTRTGTLPNGVTFTANSNGTGTLAVSATTTAVGTFPLTFTARNSTGTASQAFTLTVSQTPRFTSAATVTETAGTAFTFLVSATGFPTPAVTASAILPTDVSFAPGTNGMGTLTGRTGVVAGTYNFTFTASNAPGTAGTVSQAFKLVVNPKAAGTVPVFNSAASATATAGKAFTFQVTTAAIANVTTTLTRSGTLPAGVSFSNNGNGTAVLSGTPTAASGGTYSLTFTAKNTAGTTTQSFVLTVAAAPRITSTARATATVGSTFNFTVRTTGSPIAVITETGALPDGLTFTGNADGTAVLAGIPTRAGGTFPISIKAVNSGGTATQAFTLTVRQAVAITSLASASATVGTPITFTFIATGSPAPTITRTGTLPRGLTFTRSTGTATLSGTPTRAGTSTLTITARNSLGTTTQTFTITVT